MGRVAEGAGIKVSKAKRGGKPDDELQASGGIEDRWWGGINEAGALKTACKVRIRINVNGVTVL